MPEQVDNKQLFGRLAEILDSWPLYRRFQWITIAIKTLPVWLELYCHDCHRRQMFQPTRDAYQEHNTSLLIVSQGETQHRTYVCRNCGNGKRHFLVSWGTSDDGKVSIFMKIGQWPAFEENIPAILEKALSGGDLDLYRKAMRSRNFNFGLGAMGYLRRVVENRMNEILELIADELDQNPNQMAELKEVQRDWHFSKKVDYAASIIPKSLKPGGMNPIDVLHDVASDGLHNLPENDCIDLFDKARIVFEFVYRDLQIKKEDAENFAKSMRELANRKKSVTE